MLSLGLTTTRNPCTVWLHEAHGHILGCPTLAQLHWGQVVPADGRDPSALAASCNFYFHSHIKTMLSPDSTNCDPFLSLYALVLIILPGNTMKNWHEY